MCVCVCRTSLLKTLWEKEKLLVYEQFILSSANSFSLEESKIRRLGTGQRYTVLDTSRQILDMSISKTILDDKFYFIQTGGNACKMLKGLKTEKITDRGKNRKKCLFTSIFFFVQNVLKFHKFRFSEIRDCFVKEFFKKKINCKLIIIY